jgi:glucose/arabinose dehydrogenase
VYKLPAGAREPTLVAWGFRNPVAITIGTNGDIWIGMHGADIRSTRPILDDPDAVYRLESGAWYGWPDYSAALLPFTDSRYLPPREFMPADHNRLEPVINLAASGLRPPDRSLLLAATKPHAALSGLAFVATGPLAGRLLLAEMGDFKPLTDKAKPNVHAGFQVEILDPATGALAEFARNRSTGDATPSSTLDLRNGFERPVDVRIGPDGKIYVLDYGVFDTTGPKPRVMPKTGKVFVIEPVD